jgi:16S rRNA (adenine1518-N6/adenine1519-N6)-dimethyltransferase
VNFNLFSKKEIISILNTYGVSPKKSLGQNYLINKGALTKAVSSFHEECLSASVTEIIEVGPGYGVMTDMLCKEGIPVTAVEMDNTSFTILKDNLTDRQTGKLPDNLTLIHDDFLHYINTDAYNKNKRIALTGNLPYNISSQIIVTALEQLTPSLKVLTIMLQKEMAKRILAKPGSREYGILSVLSAYFAEIHPVVTLSPGSFFPPPKIDSMVITYRIRQETAPVKEWADFKGILRTAFNQRRKKILTALKNTSLMQLDQHALKRCLESLQFLEHSRAENLSWEQYVQFVNTYTKYKKEK